MDSAQRRMHILSCTRTETVKRKRGLDNSKRNVSYYYTLPDGFGTRQVVCKTFLLTTLGFTKNNDTVLHNVLNNTGDGSITPPTDMRGAKSHVKIEKEIIKEHIESFNPSISHYRREHAPNTRYLPSDISMTAMYADFRVKNPEFKVSYDTYRNVLHSMNISFTKLGHEECERCVSFSHQDPNHTAEKDPNCEKCNDILHHLDKAKKAREI